jgi:DNA-binding CsgD family transcriptional regulator
MRMVSGYLASAAILLHDLDQAEKVLQVVLSPDAPAQTMAQRMTWCANVELKLAQGNPARALEILDQLIVSGAQVGEGLRSLRILKLRGEALAAAKRPEEAEAAFMKAQVVAREQGARPVLWRISVAIGNLYFAQGRNAEAEQEFATARTLIEELAATIEDEPMRDNFLRLAMAMLPHTRPPSPKHVAKQAFGGLTAREREVAVLIARGKSNQEIADRLIVTRRTVETHVGNIMFKSGCTSRTQIAVWAIEVGLTEKVEESQQP